MPRCSVTILVQVPTLCLPEGMEYRCCALIQPLWINQHVVCMPHPISVPSFWHGVPCLADSLMAPDWVFRVLSHRSFLKGNCWSHYVRDNKACAQRCDTYFFIHPQSVTLQFLAAMECEIQDLAVEVKSKQEKNNDFSYVLCISLFIFSMETDEQLAFCFVWLGVLFVCGLVFFEGCFFIWLEGNWSTHRFWLCILLEVLEQQCYICIMHGCHCMTRKQGKEHSNAAPLPSSKKEQFIQKAMAFI